MHERPITPSEVTSEKARLMPPRVIEVFNRLIAQNWDGKESVVKQRDVVSGIVEFLTINESDVFERGYLEIEDIYGDAGWKVEYDKPGYNESYEPTFTFRKRRRS